MELDTPMVGLDPGGEIQFKPGPCVVAEIKRFSMGSAAIKPRDQSSLKSWKSGWRKRAHSQIAHSLVEDFACPAPTALDTEGNYVSSGETLDLAMSK
ncbi:hypothetical protein BDV12DRAFT_201382 [Aspergillus spectabilis]